MIPDYSILSILYVCFKVLLYAAQLLATLEDHSVGPDEHIMGYAGEAVDVIWAPTGVVDHIPVETVAADGGGGILRLVAHGDTHQPQPAVGILSGDLFKRREVLDAVGTPGGHEVDKRIIARLYIAAEGHRPTGGILPLEVDIAATGRCSCAKTREVDIMSGAA